MTEPPATAAGEPGPRGSGEDACRLLLVAPAGTCRDVLVPRLSRVRDELGVEVYYAEDPDGARRILDDLAARSAVLDVLVCDGAVAGGGLGLLAESRARPLGPVFRVVLVDREDREAILAAAGRVEVHRALVKPLDEGAFEESVRAFLAGAAHARALGRANRSLTTMLDIAKAMNFEKDMDKLLAMISTQATEVIGADRATIFLLSRDGTELVARVKTKEKAAIRIRRDAGIAGFVFTTAQPVNIPDCYEDPRFNKEVDRRTGYRTRNLLCTPIKNLHNEPIGVIQLLNKARGPFHREDEQFLEIFGSQAAVAIENAFLYEEMLEKKRLERTQATMRRYVQEGLLEQIKEGAGNLDLGGETKQVSVLFCDIRGFTAMSEAMEPEAVVDMLNDYFTRMLAPVRANHGVIDKFIGDALLAIFYGDEPAVTARNAVLAALDMRAALREFNEQRRVRGLPGLENGIGINTGPVVAGSIGTERRRDYTVIGDTVNTSARLEKESKQGRHTRVVVSGATLAAVRPFVQVEAMAVEAIRGKQQRVEVYELVGLRPAAEVRDAVPALGPEERGAAVDFLGRLEGSEATEALVAIYRGGDPELAIAALNALGAFRRRFDRVVHDFLGAELDRADLDPRVRASLVTAVGRVGGTRLLARLRALVHDQDERIRANTVEALGRLEDAEALQGILERLGDENGRIRANAAIALCRREPVRTVEALARTLEEADPARRSSALWALGEVGRLFDPACSAFLLSDEDAQTRQNARRVLEGVVPLLVGALQDRDRKVVRQAVAGLGRIRDARAVVPLVRLLADADAKLALEVERALRALGAAEEVLWLVGRLRRKGG
ncbi:MAG: HEAT repeat domain-containing protein [Planctomycetes bacterium]|nr:HEAT repeat domain-containing protein [Planctomycetota bacterium]